MDRRHLDLNTSLEEFDRSPPPKRRAEKGILRTGSESSGHSGAMQAVSELSKRVLSPDRDSLTRDDLQAIVESTQEHTEDKPERSSLGTNREKKSFKERRENIKNRGGMKIKEYIQTHMRDQLVHFNEYKRIIAHNQSNTEQFTTTLQQRAANALYSRLYSEFYKDDD